MKKLRDTVAHEIIKIKMTINDIKRSDGLLDELDKLLGNDTKRSNNSDRVITNLENIIEEWMELDPDDILDHFTVNPSIFNRLNDFYEDMTSDEKEYLEFLDSQKETIEDGVIYYDNDYYQHRVAPCCFTPFENCRKVEYKSIDIVKIDNDEYDCLVINYGEDDNWDNPRSCCY